MLGGAFVTPEAVLSMVPFLMSPQSTSRVELLPARGCRLVYLMAALKCRPVLMFGADVALEGLVLAEALVARREVSASESLLALVDELMSAETGGRQERLPAAVVGADMVSLGPVRALDMLLEMLLLDVVLVAAGMWANERALVVVGPEVGGETGWAVEGLVAAGICASDRLEVGRPPAGRTEGGERRVCMECGRGFGALRLGIREIAVRLEGKAMGLWCRTRIR